MKRMAVPTMRLFLAVAAGGVMGMGCVYCRLGQSRMLPGYQGVHRAHLSPSLTGPQLGPLEPAVQSEPGVILPFHAMAGVESGWDPSAVGDGGRAIGLYQIHQRYWQDSGVPGRWRDCVDPDYARRVILAYWQRYCPDALERGDREVLCRIHNGGPQGHKRKHTLKYWRKIQAVSLVSALCRVDEFSAPR